MRSRLALTLCRSKARRASSISLTGERLAAADYARDAATGRVQHRAAADRARPMLVDFNEGAASIGERSEVSAERQLTVGEIIARHQQQQRAQDAVVQNYVAHARMEQHFRPTVADPGYDVVTENTLLRRRRRRRVGGAVVFGERIELGRRSPAVSAAAAREGAVAAAAAALRRGLPLSAERHRARRRVRLLRRQVRSGARATARCIAARSGSTGGRSRAIRVQAVQSGLTAPVVSNEEIQRYAPAAIVGDAADLPVHRASPRGRSCWSPAAICCVEKKVAFTDFHVNDPDFEQRARVGARERPRDVPRNRPAACATTSRRTATRVVSDRADAQASRRWRWA